jgi:hypothetical protein
VDSGYSHETPTGDLIQRLRQSAQKQERESTAELGFARAAVTASTTQGVKLVAPTRSHAELDEAARLIYHPEERVIHEDSAGITYAVNKSWIADYAVLHRGLFELSQLLYDIAPRVLSGEMSTSVYINRIYRDILIIDENLHVSLTINSSILKRYSGRRKLILDKQYSIGEKRNWVKQQACALRKAHPGLLRCTTAKQVEHVAQEFMSALRLGTNERHTALQRIPYSILVDTRSKLGRPRTWYGFPVNPPQGSKAYFRCPNGTWVLWVSKPPEKRTEVSAQNRLEDGSRADL